MRRMVTENALNSLEERIAALEEVEYTAGNNIDITDNVVSLEDDISLDNVTAAERVTANKVVTNGIDIANDNIQIYASNNANLIYCDDTTKPLEISSGNGAWIRIGETGLVSLTMVDSGTSTAHLYEFKSDGIYLDNTKITD